VLPFRARDRLHGEVAGAVVPHQCSAVAIIGDETVEITVAIEVGDGNGLGVQKLRTLDEPGGEGAVAIAVMRWASLSRCPSKFMMARMAPFSARLRIDQWFPREPPRSDSVNTRRAARLSARSFVCTMFHRKNRSCLYVRCIKRGPDRAASQLNPVT